MVDVGDKNVTRRTAVASARVLTRPDVIERIRGGGVSKGDVIAAARIAGIMAAKRTADLIPLCHPLRIDSVRVDIELKEAEVLILAAVQATDRTGVEMEAMTAASIAALTVYDMCKAVDRAMEVTSVRLEQKSGGKSGAFVRAGE
jgi:cyclic pyranopterin phosphate synthase